MRNWARRVGAWGLAVAVTLGIAALSRVPYSAASTEAALIRLSWRARGERVEECRRLSEEERRGLPPHMRQTEVCEGRIAPYRLTLQLDGQVILDDTVRGSGARHDRPLYVYREVRVAPGTHRLDLAFQRLGDAPAEPSQAGTVPPRMELTATVKLAAGEIVLVTYDAEAERLRLRGGSPVAQPR